MAGSSLLTRALSADHERRWQEASAKVGAWMMSDEVRYFEDAEAALSWLQA